MYGIQKDTSVIETVLERVNYNIIPPLLDVCLVQQSNRREGTSRLPEHLVGVVNSSAKTKTEDKKEKRVKAIKKETMLRDVFFLGERLNTNLISWCRSGYHKDRDNGRKAWNNRGTSADLKGKTIRSTNADPRMVNSLSSVLFANDSKAAPFRLQYVSGQNLLYPLFRW